MYEGAVFSEQYQMYFYKILIKFLIYKMFDQKLESRDTRPFLVRLSPRKNQTT